MAELFGTDLERVGIWDFLFVLFVEPAVLEFLHTSHCW